MFPMLFPITHSAYIQNELVEEKLFLYNIKFIQCFATFFIVRVLLCRFDVLVKNIKHKNI